MIENINSTLFFSFKKFAKIKKLKNYNKLIDSLKRKLDQFSKKFALQTLKTQLVNFHVFETYENAKNSKF